MGRRICHGGHNAGHPKLEMAIVSTATRYSSYTPIVLLLARSLLEVRYGILILLSFGIRVVCAQTTPEKLRAITDPARWTKAGQSIRKAMVKDSLDPAPPFLMAVFYFDSRYPSFHIDSASWYQEQSSRLRQYRPPGRREMPDSMALHHLRTRIDSAAFARAKKTGTEEAYQNFIAHFSSAHEIPAAVELRDEQAYQKAVKTQTASGYRSFMDKYPRSKQWRQARERMETLEFEENTKDGKLASYRKFVKDYPMNPHRPAAEKKIFDLMTASGSPATYLRFIAAYPESRWSNRARAILFCQQRDGEVVPDGRWKSDSLKKERDVTGGYWVPVIKNDKYGFINEQGKEVVSPRFDFIPEGYRCGEITDRYLVTSRGLLARNGQLVWRGKVKDFDDLGLGFIFIASDSGGMVVHESGFRITDKPVDDALLIANRMISFNRNDKWSVVSLSGAPLMMNAFDEIAVLDSIVQLTRNGKKILTTPVRIARVAEGAPLKEDFVFDETRKWGNQHYWVRNGVLEGVVDASLGFIIPLDRQVLRKTSFGFLTTKGGNVFVQGIKNLEGKSYKQVTEQGNLLGMKDAAGRHWLFERTKNSLHGGDSVWFRGRLGFVQQGDSIHVYLPDGRQVGVMQDAPIQFRESKDSSAYMIIEEKKRKVVYDARSGAKLFAGDFDQLDAAQASLFLITRQNKRGLVRKDGKQVLPVEYDAIVPAGENSFSLLKEKKFGWYDAKSGMIVKPIYDRNVKPYNDKLWLAYREGGYYFLHADGKPVGGETWEEVTHWNDSVAWVKKEGIWKLMDMVTQKIRIDNVRQYQYISEAVSEKTAIVQQDKAFGVLSNRRGVVVPIQYTDVINLGTREIPLYYTERYISEAGITVLVYFDQRGKVVRSQALNNDELEKIACDN